VNVTAKADYAVRAAAELAAGDGAYITSERVSTAQGVPRAFLISILQDLRRAGLIESRRGSYGGHRLARDASEVTVADIIRAVEGPLADVAGRAPEDVPAEGAAAMLPQIWVATRSALREVLEHVTIADIVSGRIPPAVKSRVRSPGAWQRRRGR
jgi:Rrf2 family protein